MSEHEENRQDMESQPEIVDLSGINTGTERENLSRFQRVAAGFFAQTREPALTINERTVGVNAAATRLFPQVDYMEILVSPEDRKVAFKPCDELNISGYRWAREKDGKRYATQRTGIPFVLCVCEIMGWNPHNRHRILGKKVLDEADEEILVFDLKAGQEFEKGGPDEKGKTRSTILTGWDGTFGPNYNPEEGSLHVDTFDGYTVFSIGGRKGKKAEDRNAQPEETTDNPEGHADIRPEGTAGIKPEPGGLSAETAEGSVAPDGNREESDGMETAGYEEQA